MHARLILRAETKAGERRTPLTPDHAAILLEDGFTEILVESSTQRAFVDEHYVKAGCKIVPPQTWPMANPDTYVLGLKELPESSIPLSQKHIYFAHAYKNQNGWEKLLSRFSAGEGMLYDLEYLVDESGRRVAAFGFWAGFVGAALGVAAWCKKNKGEILQEVSPFQNQFEMIRYLDQRLSEGSTLPKVLVLGAKGRSGKGAVECLRRVGLHPIEWDIEETKRGGPFVELLEYDVVVNCVLVQNKIPEFLNEKLLSGSRNLAVIADVSCDPNGPYNPLPIYKETTSLVHPVRRLEFGGTPLDLVAIDHLPTLLPLESSQDFSEQLYPHLMELLESPVTPAVWARAEILFRKKLALARAKSQMDRVPRNQNAEVQV